MSLGGFVHFYIWNRRMACRKIAADFNPQLLKNRFLQPVCLLRIVTQLVKMLACLLPCSGVAEKLHLKCSFYAGPVKAPRWRHDHAKSFLCDRVSETKRVKITLPVRAHAAKKSSRSCDSGAARQIWKACQIFPRFWFSEVVARLRPGKELKFFQEGRRRSSDYLSPLCK